MALLISAAVATLVACASTPQERVPAAAAPQPAPPTGIVVFLVDDLGWRDVGFMGNSYLETPRADRLAAEGMVFTTAYADAPNCSPSRACLLTGLSPPHTGVYSAQPAEGGDSRRRKLVGVPIHRDLLPELVTLPEVLQAAGWRTAMFGKWHLGGDPLKRGFDVARGVTPRAAGHGGHFSPYGIPGFPDGPPGEALADRLCDEALAFVRDCGDRPFFVHLAQYSVHTPIESRASLRQKYEEKSEGRGHTPPGYAGMVEELDESFGRLLDGLEALGRARNTIVIFASDNGGRGGLSDLGGLRGGKGTLYEAGLRIPLAVRWPERIAAGGRCDAPVTLADLAPTLVAACGIEPPRNARFDGISLLPAFTAAQPLPERDLFWHFPVYVKPDKRGAPFRSKPCGAIRHGRYKLIEWFEDERLELFDLQADPGEATDLSADRPEIAADLLERMRAWRSRTGAPVPSEPNPDYVPNFAPERDR